MKTIRGGMGIGDALYVQSVARHLVSCGTSLRVHTAWPEVFKPLKVEVGPFKRSGIDILAHYSMRKRFAGTTQFEDCCIQAGIKERVDLRLDWTPEDLGLIGRLERSGRPIVCVQLPRTPMGRTDGFGADLLPDCRVIQKCIDRIKDRALIVQVGSGKALHEFRGVDVDLTNQTTVSQLLDVASAADGFLGYVSFLVPLAESFSKPALLVWASKGLVARQLYVRQITPQKVLHRKSSVYVVDDWPEQQIKEAADAFLR